MGSECLQNSKACSCLRKNFCPLRSVISDAILEGINRRENVWLVNAGKLHRPHLKFFTVLAEIFSEQVITHGLWPSTCIHI